MTIENTVQQLTGKFLNSLSAALQKENLKHEILKEPSLHIMMHMISCVQALRDKFGYTDKSKYSLSAQLFQPFLNGMLALFGKILMDSFTSEPKLSDIDNFTQGFGIVSKHILNLFPEMAIKKHKTSGKMLIHHAVFKARPAIAEETVRQILSIHPECASAKDSSGATPLHWATRNHEIATEVLDILVKQCPESPAAVDTKGFLPLHWAVNQDTPHIEVVRKLLKVYPAGASTAANNGYLPIHYCVLRDKPSASALKALMAVYPEGIRTKCHEGNLPLHIYLHRETVDLETVKLLVNFYPEALQMVNNRNQLPLHIALDVPMPNLPAIQALLKDYPQSAQQQDVDGYLPLHLSIDNAYPNYALATLIFNAFPQGAQYTTKDGLLPLHLIVSTNHNPPAAFINSVISSYPEAIHIPVTDIVPSVDMSMSEPDTWSGEWCEKQWTPLSKAKDRNMDNTVLNVFYKYGNMIKNDPNAFKNVSVPFQGPAAGVTAFVQPSNAADANSNAALRVSQPIKTVQPPQNIEVQVNRQLPKTNAVSPTSHQSPSHQTQQQELMDVEDYSSASAYSNQLQPPNSAPHYSSHSDNRFPGGAANYYPPASAGQPMRPEEEQPEVMVDNWSGNGPNGNGYNNGMPAKPQSKLPPNILKAQQRAASQNRDASPQQQVRLPLIHGNGRDQSPQRYVDGPEQRPVTPPGTMRAPPAGPIPASLLMAAENNAMRYGVKTTNVAANNNAVVSSNAPAANNRKYLNKMSNNNPNNYNNPLDNPQTRASTADETRLDSASAELEAKQKRLLQAQQIYVKRGANGAVAGNNTMLSSTLPSVGNSDSPRGGSTLASNKVYLKPTNSSTNDIIKNLGVGVNKVRIHPGPQGTDEYV